MKIYKSSRIIINMEQDEYESCYIIEPNEPDSYLEIELTEAQAIKLYNQLAPYYKIF